MILAVRFDAGRQRVKLVAAQALCPAFGNLRATRVTRAQEQDLHGVSLITKERRSLGHIDGYAMRVNHGNISTIAERLNGHCRTTAQ
jgi:hypothetical protein